MEVSSSSQKEHSGDSSFWNLKLILFTNFA